MIVTLDEAKLYLRIDGTENDILIQSLISAAEIYLKNATGTTFDGTNELAKLYCLVLVSDWFENREAVGTPGEKVRFVLDRIMAQLQYCYPKDSEVGTL